MSAAVKAKPKKRRSQPGCFPARPTTFPGPWKRSRSLPRGTWNMFANGRIFLLTIKKVSKGVVTANLSSGSVTNAKWDPATGKLTFTRVLPTLKQAFTGYLLHFDAADPKWRMAGTFRHIGGTPASGWYATRERE